MKKENSISCNEYVSILKCIENNGLISAAVAIITLLFITQRDRRSYLRIMANSNKYSFSIDIENVGVNLAKICKVTIKSGDSKKKYKLMAEIYDPVFGKSGWYISRMQSNLEKNIIFGNGVKHHIFRCEINDGNFIQLKKLWNVTKDVKITVIYFDVYGMFFFVPRFCRSHFKQDAEAFFSSLGDRNKFADRGNG